jgi:hypothetical protein
MCKKRRHNDFCYSQTLLTVQSVCMQKPLHIILQFTFFFSSKIIYLCKIGTYNADSHLISLRLNLKRKVSTLYLQSGDRAENIPRSPIPTRLNPIQILFTKMYAFLTAFLATTWPKSVLCTGIEVWCLTTLSTISQSYRGGQLHCWRGKPEYQDKPTDVIYGQWSIWLFIWTLQYSHGHTMINHCDKHITPPIDTDISFGMVSLFTDFDMPFGDSRQLSKCKKWRHIK